MLIFLMTCTIILLNKPDVTIFLFFPLSIFKKSNKKTHCYKTYLFFFYSLSTTYDLTILFLLNKWWSVYGKGGW